MEQQEDLVLDKLASGDKPAVYAAGMVAARALKESGMAVFLVDVLGRVHLAPSTAVEVKMRPRLADDELDVFSEEEAITLLVKQGDSEDEILSYIKKRKTRVGPPLASREGGA